MEKIFILYYVFINLITFVLFWVDKKRAIKGKYRISEKALLLSSFIGGALGGLISMYTFRHKTKKAAFYLSLPIMLVLHIAATVYLVI